MLLIDSSVDNLRESFLVLGEVTWNGKLLNNMQGSGSGSIWLRLRAQAQAQTPSSAPLIAKAWFRHGLKGVGGFMIRAWAWAWFRHGLKGVVESVLGLW